jgi:hypothetical protein
VRLQLKRTLGRAAVLSAVLSFAAAARADGPWRVAFDGMFYSDTDNVIVGTPRLAVRHRLDEDGGEVAAHVLVDVVSAASVDVVSQATVGFVEARTGAGIDVSGAIGDHLPSIGYRFSYEPDYLSNGGHVGWRSRLGTPDSVLSLGYGFTGDIVGRAGTPWSSFSETLFTHAGDLAFTQTLGAETVLRLSYSFTGQHGYMEKPYRHVPLFDLAAVEGQRLDFSNFAEHRLPTMPPEEVPDLRLRNALGARLLQSIESIQGSLRADYAFYADDWGMTAHTIEAALTATLVRGLRLVTYGRFYLQTAASFWRREYVVQANEVPRFRSLDRELSDYETLTGGVRLEWEVDDVAGYFDGTVMWTHFDSFLLLDERIAVLGQVGFRWMP